MLIGLLMSFVAPVMHVTAGEWTLDQAAAFLPIPLGDMVLFGGFFWAAIAYRQKPEIHKRFMLLATVALLFAAVFRLNAAGWGVPIPWILRRDPSNSRPSRHRAAALAALATALVVHFGGGALGIETVVATLALGCMLRRRLESVEPQIRTELKRFWQIAEVVLFVNLGAAVDIGQLANPAMVAPVLIVIGVALLARVAVALAMTHWTNLRVGEGRYVAVAHVPKATIQAVFGTLPLIIFTQRGQMDLIADAETLVVLAVVAIVATVPIGAFVLERWAARWLGHRDPPPAREVNRQS